MSSPFDAPALIRADAEASYLSFVSPQELTDDEKTTIRTTLGVNGAAGVGLDTDPDGTTVLVVGANSDDVGYDGGTDY